jgi:hypothetical protein
VAKATIRRARQILVPHGIPKNEIRPTRIERRARLVSAIARGRRWLDEIVSGSDVQQIANRQKCIVRQVNMTISLAFLAPDLVRAAVEGRLPRGIGRVARCASRMERAVRGAWVKSAIITGRARNGALLASKTPKIPGSRLAFAVKTLPRGTEFLDAETGG